MERELPIRVYETDTGPVLRGLCQAEAATLRLGTGNSTMTGLRSSGPAMAASRTDLSPAGVLRLIIHARDCVACQNAAADAALSARVVGA